MPNWVHEVTGPRGTAGWPEHPASTTPASTTPVTARDARDAQVLTTAQVSPVTRRGGNEDSARSPALQDR